MANNFYNAVVRNVSADSTLPTEVYKVPDTKKAILIELDVSNINMDFFHIWENYPC